MKKSVNKKVLPVLMFLAVLFLLIIWSGRRGLCISEETGIQNVKDGPEEMKEPKYLSETLPEDCKLCGNGEGTLIPVYRGQDNLGIISVNTFDIAYIQINRYDDFGRIIKKADSNNGMRISIMGENGFMSTVSADSNRGYASVDITMNQDKVLDMEKAAGNLCTACLNLVMESSCAEPYGLGVINFKTGEVILLGEGTMKFLIGDFYVICEPQPENGEDISEITLDVFYCPERYKK